MYSGPPEWYVRLAPPTSAATEAALAACLPFREPRVTSVGAFSSDQERSAEAPRKAARAWALPTKACGRRLTTLSCVF